MIRRCNHNSRKNDAHPSPFNRLTVWLEKVTLNMGCLLILKLIAPAKDKASLSFFKVQILNIFLKVYSSQSH